MCGGVVGGGGYKGCMNFRLKACDGWKADEGGREGKSRG